MSQSQRNLKSLGQRVEQKQPKATPSCLNHLLAYLKCVSLHSANVSNARCDGHADFALNANVFLKAPEWMCE